MQPPTVKRTRSLCTPSTSTSARGRRTSATSSSTVYSARSRSAGDAPSASITATTSACASGNAAFITGLHCSSPWSSTCSRRLMSISPSRTLIDASLLSPSTYCSSLTSGGAVASEANRRSAAPNRSANMRHSQRGMIASVTRPRTLDANRCCAPPHQCDHARRRRFEGQASGPSPLAHADKIAARLGSPRLQGGAWPAVHTAAFVPSSAPVAAGQSVLTRRLDGGDRVVEPDYYAARGISRRVSKVPCDNGPSTTRSDRGGVGFDVEESPRCTGHGEHRVRRPALSLCRR